MRFSLNLRKKYFDKERQTEMTSAILASNAFKAPMMELHEGVKKKFTFYTDLIMIPGYVISRTLKISLQSK